MNGDKSDRINDYFASNMRDMTPASASHATRVLYAPVSHDPELTMYCSSVLSDTELQRADRFASPADKARFIQRRAFRRFCGNLALGTPRPLSQVAFDETENGRPYLCDLPDSWFSFSSCSSGFIGVWSSTYAIGVDLEDLTEDMEAIKLAQQFFSATEVNAIEGAENGQRQQTFLQYWVLKEAALKSIGEGLPFGLDAFEFELDPDLRVVHAPPNHGGPEQFNAHIIEGIDSCAALVIHSPT